VQNAGYAPHGLLKPLEFFRVIQETVRRISFSPAGPAMRIAAS
jgi:hypothetical protein